MTIDQHDPSEPDFRSDPPAWPVVPPGKIGVAEMDYDLAYMGVYLRLEICNRSPYLVREAEFRIDGRGQGSSNVVTGREIKVGPLFPGVYFHEEVGISHPGGIGGVSFDPVAAHAVKMTPPEQMVPASEYPGISAEILEVAVDQEVPDLRECGREASDNSRTAMATVIRIRVHNAGPAIVERARLRLQYFEVDRTIAGAKEDSSYQQTAEWIFDMPRKDWNPYRVLHVADAACEPAEPLPPGGTYEFTITHYGSGPHDWAECIAATSVEVCELKLA